MLTADTFEMIETVTRDALEKHPVWAHYKEADDRDLILGWSVPAKALDDEVRRYEFCGPPPLYPVLQVDPLPERPHLVVAVKFDTRAGASLAGYVLEPHAFGIFVGEREVCFNRTLPSLSRRAAAALGSSLGEDPRRLFPLRYASGLRTHDGRPIEGEIAPFW